MWLQAAAALPKLRRQADAIAGAIQDPCRGR